MNFWCLPKWSVNPVNKITPPWKNHQQLPMTLRIQSKHLPRVEKVLSKLSPDYIYKGISLLITRFSCWPLNTQYNSHPRGLAFSLLPVCNTFSQNCPDSPFTSVRTLLRCHKLLRPSLTTLTEILLILKFYQLHCPLSAATRLHHPRKILPRKNNLQITLLLILGKF